MDRTKFYDIIRAAIGPLSQDFVDGTDALLDEGERRNMRLEHQAYILATAYHETAATMQPIEEYGKGAGYDYLIYWSDARVTECKYKPQEAYGRGYVQLTWEANYERADKECNLHGALVKNFDLALEPHIAALIIFEGMLEGWFTGQKLDDHINDDKCDYYEARTIVNGHDQADRIKNYAIGCETALRESGWGELEEEGEEELEHPDTGMNKALTDRQNELQDVIDELEKMKDTGG